MIVYYYVIGYSMQKKVFDFPEVEDDDIDLNHAKYKKSK